MAYDTTDVAAASPLTTGGILYAPLGTALPTSATATLNVAFKPLGLVGESGLTPAGEGATRDDLRAWGGDVAATVTTAQSISRWTFDLLSIFDEDVANFIYGDTNVTPTAASSSTGTKLAIQDKGLDLDSFVMVFDMQYNAKRMRIVLPNADPSVAGELAFADASLSGYSIEVTALKDSSGVRAYRYYNNDDLTA
jgi:hypothetical protein